jgi:hypothetical protein
MHFSQTNKKQTPHSFILGKCCCALKTLNLHLNRFVEIKCILTFVGAKFLSKECIAYIKYLRIWLLMANFHVLWESRSYLCSIQSGSTVVYHGSFWSAFFPPQFYMPLYCENKTQTFQEAIVVLISVSKSTSLIFFSW